MRSTPACLSVAVTVSSLTSSTAVAATTFSGIGILPGGTASSVRGISADGTTVVGVSNTGGLDLPARWTASTTLRALPTLPTTGFLGNLARQVSADGSVVTGNSNGRAFRWTNTGGPEGTTTDLGVLHPSGEGFSNAWGISDDGDTILGTAQNVSGFDVFRWTTSGGMNSEGFFDAQALSPDGNWYTALDAVPNGPFITDGATTIPIDAIAGVNNPTRITAAVSRFGTHVVGTGDVVQTSGFTFQQAFIWSAATLVTTALPDLPGGLASCAALDLSDDASKVVGWASASTGRTATIWINGVPQPLTTYLTSSGVTGFTGWRLTSATAISPDGQFIAGDGTNPQGRSEGWIVRVPAPSATTALALPLLAIARRKRI